MTGRKMENLRKRTEILEHNEWLYSKDKDLSKISEQCLFGGDLLTGQMTVERNRNGNVQRI